MEYVHSADDPPFSSLILVFRDHGEFFVYREIGKGQDICFKNDGSCVTSADSIELRNIGAPKFTRLARGGDKTDKNQLLVMYGPGDKMPVIEFGSYKMQGSSVLVDWSKSQSKDFSISHCKTGPELFTIKNEGFVLESSTTPGFTLTMGGRALTPVEMATQDLQKTEQKLADEMKRLKGQ